MKFKYDGIPVQHVVFNNKRFLLLLTKDHEGQYTNLTLVSPYYYSINVYFLDAYLRYEDNAIIALERLKNKIERDIISYLRRGNTYESMLDKTAK